MSRWGKNIVVPLDSLCKEKENNNRPTVARSVGTVGKWGKMGFTSTRTYALSALPAAVAAAAAAAAAAATATSTSPATGAAAAAALSPASVLDDDLSLTIPEPPKPKKFFKSRNTAPPEVIAQIIQHLPHRVSTSPIREMSSLNMPGTPTSSSTHETPIKLIIPKNQTSAERKKKTSAKKKTNANATSTPIKSAPHAMSGSGGGGGGGVATNAAAAAVGDVVKSIPVETPKSTKKKKEKELKPEAPPSRILGRARKAVNYCEVDDDERIPTPPVRDVIKTTATGATTTITTTTSSRALRASNANASADEETIPSASIVSPTAADNAAGATATNMDTQTADDGAYVQGSNATAAKTPEHPPIVLRISKGTSRLVSTDSEEQPNSSPAQLPHQSDAIDVSGITQRSRNASIDEVPAAVTATTTPKIILKPPRPPETITTSTTALIYSGNQSGGGVGAAIDGDDSTTATGLDEDDTPEINYCTVKISPDKPPKERLKLIIKTDVIRNAIAKAAAAAKAKEAAAAERAAAAAAAASSTTVTYGDECRNEKKSKSKKHKHPKHYNTTSAANEHLLSTSSSTAQVTSTTTTSEFKTPSPHLVLSEQQPQQQHLPQIQQAAQQQQQRGTVISPTTRSEHDFDSQSSVLGSISSKGNSTPQLLAQAVQEESCVIRSRGSSVITSDLETSQHSSLVAPPSDIESRLESMMMTMDGGQQRAPPTVEEPLHEDDILAVLRGDEIELSENAEAQPKLNGMANTNTNDDDEMATSTTTTNPKRTKRATRARGRAKTNTNANINNNNATVADASEDTISPPTRKRGRGRAAATHTVAPVPETQNVATPKRTTRRGAKKIETALDEINAMDVDEPTPNVSETIASSQHVATPRRGRAARNNNNNTNNNNNNKISPKSTEQSSNKAASTTTTTTGTQRSYGRKRKNQQITDMVTPSAVNEDARMSDDMTHDNEDDDDDADLHGTPAKLSHTDFDPSSTTSLLEQTGDNSNHSSSTLHNDGSSCSSPMRRDYKFKDKFKRTLTLDTQQAAAAAAAAAASANAAGECLTSDMASPNMHNAATATAVTAASSTTAQTITSHGDGDEQQRGAVKLVISKKKGSIFKSRALVPSDQAEQATVAKRHLYKHSWDATLEANGTGNASDASNASPSNLGSNSGGGGGCSGVHKSNDAKSNIMADIYADFNDSSMATSNTTSGTSTLRGDSPSLGKLTRVIKPNPQVSGAGASSSYDLDDDLGCSSGAINTDNNVNSLRVDRKSKEYYTVVRNVKTAHQIQESGESQEMDDDVEYILDALQPHNPPATRCLSALQLATKCMTPSFRMHVRAHGVVTKFFKALSDANKDLSLGLCTSAIMYILSQEGLNMDLDRDSLELMINLLEAEGGAASNDRDNYKRNKQKVRELCEEIKAQGKATHLNVDSITVGTLAMETLLSLTSKRAGEWFKEDLRKLGGLEHIIKTISDFCHPITDCDSSAFVWTPALLDNMQTVARCLRVLENVTQHNESNQKYMLTFNNGAAVNTLCTLYRHCDRQLMLYPTNDDNATTTINSNGSGNKDNPGVVMRELLIPILKVLINLTHTFSTMKPSLGAELLGKRQDVLDTSFHLLLLAPNYIPDRCVFELSILVLTLLINLCMHTVSNRAILMKAYAPSEYIPDQSPTTTKNQQQDSITVVQAVLEYFYKCEELARLVEKNTDAFLEDSKKTKKKQEEVDETVNNLMQRAGHHMEHTLKGSYAGILIGHLINDNEQYEAIVRAQMRGNNFKEIVAVLEKYHTFMNLTAGAESAVVAHIKSTKKIIDEFKKRDYIYENSDDIATLPLNLELTQQHQHQQQQQQHDNSKHATNKLLTHNNSSSNSSSSSSNGGDSPQSNGSSSPAQTTPTTRSTMPRVYKTYGHR